MVHPHMLNLKYMKMYTSSTPLRLPCTQNRIIIFRTHGSVEKDGWWWVSFFETLSNKLGKGLCRGLLLSCRGLPLS